MKKIVNVLLAMLLCAALLVGCGGSETTSAAATEQSSNGWAEDAAPEEASGEAQPGEPVAMQNRKLIHNAELHLESKQFDDTKNQLMQALKTADGYVEYSSEQGSAEEGGRSAEYTLRVPCQNYRSFLQDAADAGSLLGKNESVQDVTGQYVDVQARLESLKVQEQRLLELAAQAQTMEDLLVIEEHLSTVRYQIEAYTAQQNVLDDQIDYSTVQVFLTEVTVYSPVNHSFGHQISEAVKGSWENFVAGCQDFVIWFIYALPTLLIWAAVIVVLVMVLRKWNTPERKEKRAQKHAEKARRAAQKAKGVSSSVPTEDAAYGALYAQNQENTDQHNS